ncbi:MAG: helix-turn-helix transcriptional regulator [Tetrasphaera sp.]|jgi:transcriptional regulator with XRE-family HTH domain|nr:helix-turn-helix transcriptional regulator [Tetrasphaera sp.]
MTQVQTPQSDFDRYLAKRLEEPAVRAGYEDHAVLQRVIDRLVGFRRVLGLTQTDVAKRMGVGQSTVSGFETEMSDPRLSTLQRYARAVEARLDVTIDWSADCDWVDPKAQLTGYKRMIVKPVEVSSSPVDASVVSLWAKEAARARRQDFTLSA